MSLSLQQRQAGEVKTKEKSCRRAGEDILFRPGTNKLNQDNVRNTYDSNEARNFLFLRLFLNSHSIALVVGRVTSKRSNSPRNNNTNQGISSPQQHDVNNSQQAC